MKIRILILVGLVAGMLSVVVSLQGSPARAVAGPCGTAQGDLSGPETELLGLLNAWRASTLGQPAMVASAPANWAAQIHAEAIASGQASGHTDSLDRGWEQRLLDCGYPSNFVYYGSGEALAGFPTEQPGGSAGDALASITSSQPGHQNGAQAPVPWECAGIGYASSQSGAFRHVWVVVVASAPSSSACPQSVTGTPPTATTTATNTPTLTPTPSPTPSPTPTARPGAPSVYLGAGWNLAVLPPGPVGQVLARADGCYRAVYQWDGSRWLRYLPGTPDYANNLWTLNGGTFWVEGTAANCGLVTL